MRKLASGKLVVKKRDHYELIKKASARPSAHAVSPQTRHECRQTELESA
jgi:hypothetical protein